jgi:putative flippase GtrA
MSKLTFIRFALVGLANTAVGYLVIMLLHYGFGVEPVPANVGGYLIGALLSYTLNKKFTFASARPHAEALPRFGLAVVGCFLLNLMVLNLCLTVFLLPVALAQALAVCAYTIAFYFASRFLVFRS